MDIRDAIHALAGTPAPTIVVGTVVSTDGTTATVQPLDDTAAPLPGIDLGVGPTSAIGFRPDEGAVVLVALDSPTTGYVVGTSRGRLVLNGGELGAMVSIGPLVDAINAIKKDLNDLKTAFKGWTPTPQDGGAALKSATSQWAADTLSSTATDDLADNNITH